MEGKGKDVFEPKTLFPDPAVVSLGGSFQWGASGSLRSTRGQCPTEEAVSGKGCQKDAVLGKPFVRVSKPNGVFPFILVPCWTM